MAAFSCVLEISRLKPWAWDLLQNLWISSCTKGLKGFVFRGALNPYNFLIAFQISSYSTGDRPLVPLWNKNGLWWKEERIDSFGVAVRLAPFGILENQWYGLCKCASEGNCWQLYGYFSVLWRSRPYADRKNRVYHCLPFYFFFTDSCFAFVVVLPDNRRENMLTLAPVLDKYQLWTRPRIQTCSHLMRSWSLLQRRALQLWV